MVHEPQTWHYGLVARWWAEFKTAGPEIAYFQRLITRYGQPALDVACGTGRLLLPYLRAGLDVDGCDISPDMLALCQEKAAREGLSPRLYRQAMHALDVPRTYKTLFVCGAFGIGGDSLQDQEALRRFYQHIAPGGVLALDLYLPYQHCERWQYWVRDKWRQLPEAWPPSGQQRRTADGSEYVLRSRLVALDPLQQLMTLQIRVEVWRQGQLLAAEERTLRERLYFRNELLMLLQQAGFGDITVHGAYTDAEATAEDDILVFIARK
jgi:SAM-dependent methyltransferase